MCICCSATGLAHGPCSNTTSIACLFTIGYSNGKLNVAILKDLSGFQYHIPYNGSGVGTWGTNQNRTLYFFFVSLGENSETDYVVSYAPASGRIENVGQITTEMPSERIITADRGKGLEVYFVSGWPDMMSLWRLRNPGPNVRIGSLLPTFYGSSSLMDFNPNDGLIYAVVYEPITLNPFLASYDLDKFAMKSKIPLKKQISGFFAPNVFSLNFDSKTNSFIVLLTNWVPPSYVVVKMQTDGTMAQISQGEWYTMWRMNSRIGASFSTFNRLLTIELWAIWNSSPPSVGSAEIAIAINVDTGANVPLVNPVFNSQPAAYHGVASLNVTL
jgi:hypothetical protein